MCTDEYCDSATVEGCQYPARNCSDGDYCTQDICDVISGCVGGILIDCDLEFADKTDCQVTWCNQTLQACQIKQSEDAVFDCNGICHGPDENCPVSTEAAVGIAAGALVGIIIAAIAVCLALGIFGGKKGYDVWVKHRNNMAAANSNPLYDNQGLAGTNPLFEEMKK